MNAEGEEGGGVSRLVFAREGANRQPNSPMMGGDQVGDREG